ncbi:doublecortin domain-containing protein 2 isoform X3 [Stegostoma tigrinum]|nr:doublecortin domain-containing protein 2 isoform X3 [Stegostoma tigrinum]XP_048387034.1 doublecortin domain-containing protein 2 isoform X3 [Stegostoma tigrinum]XP_048387035.1 doublecortin domain-containing protein 2 isoform X3 [Stegostoma tigrinum]XP_048387036.1 doublecortin domain-containing protein 2 isoform X3 [Stegostoma tigrinum]
MATSSRGAPLQLPAAKSVIVYRNGDPFFTGRRFLINKQVSTFDTFLNQVTKGINAPFGAVRNIYTPKEGHRVFDLDDLENGGSYVAAGVEKFKTLDYLQITTKKPQKKTNEMIRPVVHSRILVSARWRKYNYEPCTINIFTNGDLLIPPVRLLLPKYTAQDWNRVLALITEKVHLRTGAVQRLCTLDGRALLGAAELDNNQYYVAVGSEKFKKLPYYQALSKKITGRETQGFHSDLLPPIRRGRKGRGRFELQQISHGGSSDSGLLTSPQQSEGDSSHSTTDGQVGPPQTVQGQPKDLEAKPSREKNSIFRAKPMKVKHHKHSTDPLADYEDNGVFKAQDTRKETQGAAEVREDADMRVDLPIDQIPAEIVHEEEIPSYDDTAFTTNHKEDTCYEVDDYENRREQWNDPNGWTGDEDGLVENVQEYNKTKEDSLSNNIDHITTILGNSNTLPTGADELHSEQEDSKKEGSRPIHDGNMTGVTSEQRSLQSAQKDPVSHESETCQELAENQQHIDEVSELEKAPRGQEKFRKLFGFHFRKSAKSMDGYKDNK